MIVKVVGFTVVYDKLRVFLPDGRLPQGQLQKNESLDETALRIFKGALKILPKESYLEQLYTFSHNGRIEVVYYILLPSHALSNNVIPNLFRDPHKTLKQVQGDKLSVRDDNEKEIIDYAVQRLQWKIEYTNVVYALLPREFTLSELQITYEAILGKELDKRNFRKKILSLKLLKDTGKKRTGTAARPASVYEFKKRVPVRVKVF